MEETQLSSLLKNLFYPSALPSFRYPFQNVNPVVYLHRSELGEPEEISLDPLFPFMTVQDIKTYIYILKDKAEEFQPAFQCLLVPLDPEPSAKRADAYIPLDYAFVNIDKKGKVLATHQLIDPFQRIQSATVDDRFVTSTGDKKILKISDRSNSTMEDIFPELFGSNNAVLHLFLYSDVVASVDEESIKTNREWNGRIYPYFPELSQEYEVALEDENEKRYLDARVTYVSNTLYVMDVLNDLISTETGSSAVALTPIKMVSLKFLRLFWKKPFQEAPDVESLFYQLPVQYSFPFLRIIPSQGVPITKLYVESALRIPSFDPRLIPQWAEQKGPSKDDFLYGKVMIRNKDGSEPALFGTLRIFDDRSADFILQPPKNLKKLLLRDLPEFPTFLTNSIEKSYLSNADVDIGEAAVVCGVPIGLKQVSKQQFLRRLKAFSCLFQEIPPLPNETPMIMLRYRAVSKFTAEDKIFTFLTQYNSRKIAMGELDENYVRDMVYALMDTFKIRFNEATDLYIKWNEQKEKITLNVAETKDFVLQYNKGIDIAVFAQQSAYSFHLYRVDSSIHLRRILTALSLLLSADDDDLDIGFETSDQIQESMSVIDEEEKQKDDIGLEDFPDDLENVREMNADLLGEEFEEEEEEVVIKPLVEVKPVVQAKPKEELIETKAKPIREYFTKKLYDIDPELFPSTEGVVRGKVKDVETKTRSRTKDSDMKQPYSIKCQSTDDRQPIALNEEQFEAMVDEYKNDDVTFLEFPLREGEKTVASGEVIPVLRYGSSSLKLNYYVCCKYFCTRDYIMVLEKDLLSRSFRPPKFDKDGNEIQKEPNTCPFCEGKVIVDKKKPGPNEWVYKRKDGNNKYIKLLTHTVHPRGLFQPCCFGTMPKYRLSDKQFEHLQYRAKTEEDEEEEERETTVTATATQGAPINYQLTLFRAYKKYIVEKKRLPLEIGDIGGPQIGLLLPILDSYFLQEDQDIIHTPQQKQELKPDSKAFLRVGVDNRQMYRNESFFSAVAPFLDLNSADDVRRRILERVDPRNFLFLNYGNLLLEFYNPSDAKPVDTELRLWSQKNLEVDLNDQNKDAVLRLWKSYHRFLEFVQSRNTFKEYRQFAQMLAMPGFLTVRGIVFVVLDIVKKDDMDTLEIRCPPYGYDNEQYADSDIAFLIHHHSGVWEPIFYSENERAHRQFGERHEVTLKFQRSLSLNWPPIVQKRVLEFTQKCVGSGRAAWTSASEVDSYALIPVSRAIQGMVQTPEGVIRDAYNHIVALTFRAEPGKSKLVALPVVDDGTIVTPLRLHFDWDDFQAASIDSVVKFYRENIEPIFSYYPGYSIRFAVRDSSTKKIVAVQLTNGLYVPCSAMKSETNASAMKLLEGLKVTEIEEMEWAINRDIIFGKQSELPEESLQSEEYKVNEAFEYLRLSFSNWFSSDEVSGDLRSTVEKIIFSKDYPLFEKRKRLEIVLGPTLLSWMDSEEEFKDEQKSLLRVDCRLHTGPECPAQCVWKPSASKRCLLHVPEKEESDVNVPMLLMRRLFEELLRFPERRKQLLEKQVSPLVSLREAIQIKDQYIVPESSLAWYDLLRADWLTTTKEKKKFYEEMSRPSETMKIAPPSEENQQIGALSEDLVNLLGTEEEAKGLYLYRPDSPTGPSILPFIVSLGTFPGEIGLEDDDLSLTDESMRLLALITRRPIIQINLQAGETSWQMYGPAKKQKDPTPFILVAQDLDQGGPAMLSLSPTSPIPIPVEKLTSGLKFLYDERTLVTESKKNEKK
jgi:hypothetical protein